MFCQKCGASMPSGTTVCPSCGTVYATAEEVNSKKSKKLINAPSDRAKSFAAVFSALLVFPATLSLALNLTIFDRHQWAGYVIGFMLVLWTCIVLPILKITPAPVTACLCFLAITGYIFFIMNKLGKAHWLYEAFFPMFILSTALFAAMVALISSGTVKGIHIVSLLSAEIIIFLVALEATWDNYLFDAIDLGWSLVVSCSFVSVIAVIEAFAYVGRINKK